MWTYQSQDGRPGNIGRALFEARDLIKALLECVPLMVEGRPEALAAIADDAEAATPTLVSIHISFSESGQLSIVARGADEGAELEGGKHHVEIHTRPPR